MLAKMFSIRNPWAKVAIALSLGAGCMSDLQAGQGDPVAPPVSASAIPALYEETERVNDSLFLSATNLYLTDKTDQALEAYLQLLEKDPLHATAAFQIANILSDRRSFSEAMVYAEKAALLQEDNEWFQLLLAQLYKTNREFGKAAEVFAKLQELRPDKLDYAYERANMYVLLGDLRSAISVYDGLQERLGYTDAWSMQKYKIYLSLADEESARREIEGISQAIPGQPKYLEMLAQMHMKEKEYKQAYAYLKKVLEIKPDDPLVHVSLVDYYRSTGNFKQAYLSLEKAVENPLLDFQTKLNLLRAYYTGKDELKPQGDVLDQAASLFQKLNETHPNEAEGFFDHARFQLMLNQPRKAVSLLEHAITLDSNVSSCWELLLLSANTLADTALMKQAGLQAAQRFPEQAFPYMYLAIASFLEKQLDEAVQYAGLCQKRNRGHNPYMEKIVLQIMGDSYFETGRTQESLQAYQALFRLDPNDPYVRNNYAYYLALTGSSLDFAEQIAADLCKSEPKNATFLDTYAWVLYQSGNYDKALDAIKQAHRYDEGKDATILEHYGDILDRLGEKEKALEFWKKALQKKPDNKPLEEKMKQGNPAGSR